MIVFSLCGLFYVIRLFCRREADGLSGLMVMERRLKLFLQGHELLFLKLNLVTGEVLAKYLAIYSEERSISNLSERELYF